MKINHTPNVLHCFALLAAISFGTINLSAQIPGCHPDFGYIITGNVVEFTDSSTFDVGPANTTWSWNFGDGNKSKDQNPQHTYTLNQGEYIVCLTVSNCSSWPGVCCTETYCDTIRIDDVATGMTNQSAAGYGLSVFPNPSSGDFEVSYQRDSRVNDYAEIFDVNGKRIFISNTNQNGNNRQLTIPGGVFTSSGTYLLRIISPGSSAATILISKL